MNSYPTQRQAELMTDVSKHPGESLKERAARLGITRSGVLQILYSVEKKRLAERDCEGKWSLTLDGRKWLRGGAR